MFGTKNTTLQEKIILLLKTKKLSAKSILVAINNQSTKNYSIQAIYDQLRILVSDEVVLKESQVYVINNDWLIYLKHLFSKTITTDISQDQKNIYICSSLIEVDKLWKSLFYSFPNNNDVFIYNPEPFWHLIEGRRESEFTFFKEQKKKKRNSYCVVGGSGEHYQNYKKIFKSKNFFIEAQKIESMDKNMHITVFGEYILYVKINELIDSKIKKIFKKISKKELSMEINNISYENSKHKLIFEHNPKKSLILKKRIARIFFSEKEILNMF